MMPLRLKDRYLIEVYECDRCGHRVEYSLDPDSEDPWDEENGGEPPVVCNECRADPSKTPTPEETEALKRKPKHIARKFKRVRYSYHRDVYALLGHRGLASQFDAIWKLCEPHMETDPHDPQVGGQPPEYWLPYIDNPAFHTALREVLDAEATEDEQKGRTRLAALLREAIRLIEPLGV